VKGGKQMLASRFSFNSRLWGVSADNCTDSFNETLARQEKTLTRQMEGAAVAY
jgi:hypothetical protein